MEPLELKLKKFFFSITRECVTVIIYHTILFKDLLIFTCLKINSRLLGLTKLMLSIFAKN